LIVPDVMNARYSYGGGKLACELMAVNWGRTDFERMTIFRPHNVYGPDMGWEHVIPQFALRMLDLIEAQPTGTIKFPIKGNGGQTRAFVHIDDFTDGLMAMVERGKHMNIYHIGNPEEVTMGELAGKIGHYFGREIELEYTEAFAGETQRRCPDITKLKGLGYNPSISLEKGLESIIEWYRANRQYRDDRMVVTNTTKHA